MSKHMPSYLLKLSLLDGIIEPFTRRFDSRSAIGSVAGHSQEHGASSLLLFQSAKRGERGIIQWTSPTRLIKRKESSGGRN